MPRRRSKVTHCLLCEGPIGASRWELCEECLENPSPERRCLHRAPVNPRLTVARTSEIDFDSSYRNNPYILAWWTDAHDAALIELIEERGWSWPWHARERIVEMTPESTLEKWRS